MASDKYIRWQGYTIAQLTFALNLFLGLSAGSLAFAITLMRDDTSVVSGCLKRVFGVGIVALALTVVFGCSAVVSRLFDFRNTGSKIRADEKADPDNEAGVYKYRYRVWGKLTWWLFWLELLSFVIGLAGLIVASGRGMGTSCGSSQSQQSMRGQRENQHMIGLSSPTVRI